MDLQSRKIELVKYFLGNDNEDIVSKLENFLHLQAEMDLDKNIKATSVEELNRRIDKSEDDLKMRGIKV
jgi:L-lactate utilization protein LutB